MLNFRETYWIGASMRPTLVVTIALPLLLGGVAEADARTRLAETSGIRLGNAHRCGVPTGRIEHAGTVIQDLIVAVSYDSTEEAAADSRLVQIFSASAFPDQTGGALIPPCKVVIGQFERLERHHQQAGMDWKLELSEARTAPIDGTRTIRTRRSPIGSLVYRHLDLERRAADGGKPPGGRNRRVGKGSSGDRGRSARQLRVSDRRDVSVPADIAIRLVTPAGSRPLWT